MTWNVRAALVLGFVLTACGGGGDGDPEREGATSGATCPPSSTLTYQGFGRAFMVQYCTACHASAVRGADRQGAPSDHDFDTIEGIREVGAEHLDADAAAGTEKVNTEMPPSNFGAQPSEAQRRQFGEWLACGLP